MKSLAIYDNTGTIYLQMNDTYIAPESIEFLEVEIPDGKILKSIDTSVTPNVAVFEDTPLSDIDSLKQQLEDLQNYIIAKESSEATSSN